MTPSNTRQRTDSICSTFRRLLASGQTPKIEDYLNSVSGLDRTRLFVELLDAEIAYRKHFSDTDADEYMGRFPQFAPLVKAAFHNYAPTVIGDTTGAETGGKGADFTQGCPLFSVVPAEILRQHCTEESFAAGEFLIRQNEVGDSLMVIRHGNVEVTVAGQSGESHFIDEAGPGEIIGEMALLTSERRTASVRATEDVQILRLPAPSFHQLANQYPGLSTILTQLVAMRLETKSGHDTLTEKVLNGHRIRRQLGQGSMGIVYEADDLTHNRRVALKMMSHRLVYSREARARFQQEADVIQSLNHRNIVRSHSRFDAFHTCFIAMEFCEGRTLQDMICSESPLPEDLCRRIIGGIAAAIHYAHRNDIIHLDLKPSNVMVSPKGITKLMDFGLAQLVSEPRRPDGTVSGTVRYMPPEQRVGAIQNCRADYFALGCIAWEMFSGQPLFSASVGLELARDFRKWKPPDWSAARAGLHHEIRAVLAPSLAVDPSERDLDIECMARWSADG